MAYLFVPLELSQHLINIDPIDAPRQPQAIQQRVLPLTFSPGQIAQFLAQPGRRAHAECHGLAVAQASARLGLQ